MKSVMNMAFLLWLVSLHFIVQSIMAQPVLTISLNHKIETPGKIQSFAFAEDLTYWVSARRNELLILKGNSILSKNVSGIVYPPPIDIIGDTIFFGHKVFSRKEGEFAKENDLFEKISSYFGGSYHITIKNSVQIISQGSTFIHAAYTGPSREPDAEDNYNGVKHRLMLYKRNGNLKEISQSDYSFSAIGGNEDYLVASSHATYVWNVKGDKVAELPDTFNKLIFHKKLKIAVAINNKQEAVCYKTDSWQSFRLPDSVDVVDIAFHPELAHICILESDRLRIFTFESGNLTELTGIELEEKSELLRFSGTNRLVISTKNDKLFFYDVNYE